MIRNGYGHMVLEAYVAKLREMRRQRQATLGAIIVEGRKAVALKRWEKLSPKRLKYRIIFATGEAIGYNQIETARDFTEGKQP